MYFRDDGFVEAGSRFSTMPTHVLYGAKNYNDAIIEGIKASLAKPISENEFEKKKMKDIKQKEVDAKKFADVDGKNDKQELLEIVTSAFKAGTKDQKGNC